MDHSFSATGNATNGIAEILKNLPGDKKVEILNLIQRYKTGRLSLQDFVVNIRNSVGPRICNQLVSSVSSTPIFSNASSSKPIQPYMTPLLSNAKPISELQSASAFVSMPSISTPTAAFNQSSKNQANGDEETNLSYSINDDSQIPIDDKDQIDASSLQDVIQYSGVDLKEEAENILKGHEAFLHSSSYQTSEDARSSCDLFLTGSNQELKKKISSHCKKNYLKAYHDDVFYVLGFAVKEKLCRLIEQTSQVSKHRLEYSRLKFKIKIENDPMRQVWVLQNHLKNYITAIDSTTSTGNQFSPNSQQPIGTDNTKGPTVKKFKKNPSTSSGGPGGSSSSSKDVREDVAIKTKLANVTAMAALGLAQKSWMTQGASSGSVSGGLDVSSSSGVSNDYGRMGSESFSYTAGPHWKSTHSMDKEILANLRNRSISVSDLLFVLEQDSYFCKSKTFCTIFDSLRF